MSTIFKCIKGKRVLVSIPNLGNCRDHSHRFIFLSFVYDYN